MKRDMSLKILILSPPFAGIQTPKAINIFNGRPSGAKLSTSKGQITIVGWTVECLRQANHHCCNLRELPRAKELCPSQMFEEGHRLSFIQSEESLVSSVSFQY
jgi:hypothetical protein